MISRAASQRVLPLSTAARRLPPLPPSPLPPEPQPLRINAGPRRHAEDHLASYPGGKAASGSEFET